MKKLGLFIGMLMAFATLFAQNPKREMRAAWLATVWGIDWPNSKITTTGDVNQINGQKKALTRMLDSLQRANLNTVFFQVRSRSDVLFKSKYEPWSSDLVASRGMDPGYDPLQFAIEECHKRGMELHAWMNPYRFESAADQWKDQPGDYRKTNPEWVMTYSNGSSILNPGIPAVAERIRDIVMEVVENYDVDGITFDDYFYAYGGTPSTLDQAAQDLYKPAGKNVNDWRRENVNAMIALVYNSIQQSKPWITFGVSPFGIWTTDQKVAEKEGIPLPSGITGGNMYAEIYCDPVAWLKEGTVDYISPQLYWPTTSAGQDYDVLSPWWSDLAAKFGKHFYSSHSLSSLESVTLAMKSARINGVSVELNNAISMREKSALLEKSMQVEPRILPAEYILQIQRNRTSDRNDAPGSVFYSANRFYTKGFIPSLLKSVFSTNALPPAIHWKSTVQYGPVNDLSLTDNTLSWAPVDGIVRYAVYAIKKSELADPKTYFVSTNLLGISYATSYDVPVKLDKTLYTFGIVALDRFGNESTSSVLGAPQLSNNPVLLQYPINGDGITNASSFVWESNPQASSYFLEVAESPAFENLIYCFETTSSALKAENMSLLKNGQTYYWRVRSRVSGTNDAYSQVRSVSFVSLEIVSPLNNSKDVSVTPQISWTSIGTEYKYTLQVSVLGSFNTIVAEYTNITGTSFTLPKETLLAETLYYIRVKGVIGNDETSWSPVVSFTTETLIPNVPIIVSPTNLQQLSGTELLVKWEDEPNAKSFRVELSETPDFPVRKVIIKSAKAFTYQVTYTDLVPGTYYLRARANYGYTNTAWSDIVQIDMLTTSLDKAKADGIKVYALKEKKSLIIQTTNEIDASELCLYSVTGQQVYSKNVNLNAGIQNVISLPQSVGKGAFIVVLKSKAGRNSFKIIL